MGDLRFDDFVALQNGPDCPAFEIPTTVADLLRTKIGLTTGGTAKHGLRWEKDGKGLIFLENISRSKVHLYILPTSILFWRTPTKLKGILSKTGFLNLWEQIGTGRGGDDLRIKNVSWSQAYSLIPILAKWSFSSQTGRELVQIEVIPDSDLPLNIGKNGKAKMADGSSVDFTIEDEILLRQTKEPHQKIICLQKLNFNDETVELRFGYYVSRENSKGNRKWIWGQYSPIAPPEDFCILLQEANDRNWL